MQIHILPITWGMANKEILNYEYGFGFIMNQDSDSLGKSNTTVT